jgi:hypothetical protein
MKKLTITITITEPETLEIWGGTQEGEIADDFLGCPEAWVWLEGTEVEVAKG